MPRLFSYFHKTFKKSQIQNQFSKIRWLPIYFIFIDIVSKNEKYKICNHTRLLENIETLNLFTAF